ncbi:MAG: glycosyltransferase family 2 protein [Planctomycetes bacterium]|nr:glycosyltransferase family 2 protein [Planctomycetota bacterium]
MADAPSPTPPPTSVANPLRRRGLAIMPAYNESGQITGVVGALKRAAPGFDVLVIDDGSRDNTAAEALAAGAMVVRHPFNLGYGAALQTGYKFAATSPRGYDVLVQLDADGQHDPAYVQVLADRVRSGEVDVCVGSRFLVGSGYIPPFARRVGMVLFGYIASVVTRRRVTDPTSGYQALGRRVFEYFQSDLFPADYPDADVLILLHRAGFRAEEQPVAMKPNPIGQSMHGGLIRPMFYVFKMFLSIFVTLLREPPPPPPK